LRKKLKDTEQDIAKKLGTNTTCDAMASYQLTDSTTYRTYEWSDDDTGCHDGTSWDGYEFAAN
jgi:hypothetical protein